MSAGGFPDHAPNARRFVTAVLATWGVGDEFVGVPLVTSELVTNAVLHVGGDVVVSVALASDRVRVEVSDDSPALPAMRDLDGARDGGWGLHIVDRVGSRWGLEPRADGKTVWCEVPRSLATGPNG